MTTAVILGTRPEAIRLYYTVRTIGPEHVLWTGQNYSKNLSDDILYDPRFGDTYKGIDRHDTQEATEFHEQFSVILKACYNYLYARNPDQVLILGDTNSSLAAALAAKKLGIRIYHMEAGNRCYNPKSPEEVNRRMIDSIADVHLCYTGFAKQNLLSEGVPQNRIHVIGNPMAEFPEMHEPAKSKIHALVDIHRAENEKYLQKLASILDNLKKEIEVKLILHPRFYELFKDIAQPSVCFSDFVSLERNAALIITDSGTVCEEAAMLGKPCVVWRETMERPELLELGNTVLRSPKEEISDTIDVCLDLFRSGLLERDIPKEYESSAVSLRVKRILQGTGNFI